MLLEPNDWGVVIVGRWNPAILTPAGIKNLIFKMNKEEKVEVAVPLDGVSPYLVKNPKDNITVVTELNRLLIQLNQESFETLEKAKEAGINALESLPQTPFAAAGFNIRFKTANPVSELNDICDSKLDSQLGELSLEIISRAITRTVVFKGGQINIIVKIDKSGSELLFNFHLDSNDRDKLVQWLQIPIGEVKEQINHMLTIIGLNTDEGEHDDDKE